MLPAMSHLALSGEDGGDELGVGVAALAEVAGDGLDVVRHAAVGDHQLITAVFEKQPAGGAARAGQSRAAGIEGTDVADETIGDEVSVAADHDVGVGSGQQSPELLICDIRVYPWAVVGLG